MSKYKFSDMNAMGSFIFCLNFLHDIGVTETFWYIIFFYLELLECLVLYFTDDRRSKDNRTCSFVKPKNVSRLVLKFCFT